MELKSLRLFMDVADTGSFNSAAERRHTVQSNVTAHIKKLEHELGVQLFDRKGGATLTTAGNTVADYARKILSAHDDVIQLFNGEATESGRLRIGAMETTTAVRLPSILSRFHALHPEVDLTVETGPTGYITEQLLKGELDGIFVAGKTQHQHFYSEKAFSERLVLIGHRSMHTIPTAEQLLSGTFLAFRQGCSYRQRIELFLASMGVNAARIFEFGSIDGILGCVASGMGYTIMPESTALAHQNRFDIRFLPLPTEIAEIDTYFTSTNKTHWSPALTAFAAMLFEDRAV